MQTKKLPLHHLYIHQTICLIKIISRQREVGAVYDCIPLCSCIHVTAQLMEQITCEAATDTQSQIWVIYIQVFVSCHDCLYGWALTSSSSTFLWRADSYMWYFAWGVALHDH